MREWENEVNAKNTKQPTLPKFQTWAKFEMKKRQLGLLGGFGRKRRSSEEGREDF